MRADVDQPPGAHPVPLGIGAAQHPGLERRLLPGRQCLRPTRTGPIVQARRPLGIVPDHGIPERLPLHPGQPCRLSARQTFKCIGDRQQAHRGTAVRLEAAETAKLGGG